VIGPGWAGEDRPTPTQARAQRSRRVAVVTGSRADYGLLRPAMRAIGANPALELAVVAAGAHLIPPAHSFRDVKAEFPIADSVPMQKPGRTTRPDDAEALGVGVARMARAFRAIEPEWRLVLGDRVEAFAAACAAAVGGWPLAHVHGGDRAEGVADEAMRHAISKLAHLHLPATSASAERLEHMGEPAERIHVVGSPAIDGLDAVEPLTDEAHRALGTPRVALLLHPVGRPDEAEEHAAGLVIDALQRLRLPLCVLEPNHDPGRRGVLAAIDAAGLTPVPHMPRQRFLALLKRLAAEGGALVGNSSAGLIEAPALGVRVLDIGPRQHGRQRPPAVHHADDRGQDAPDALERALLRTLADPPAAPGEHPYGDGRAGERIAQLLASIDPNTRAMLAKLNAY